MVHPFFSSPTLFLNQLLLLPINPSTPPHLQPPSARPRPSSGVSLLCFCSHFSCCSRHTTLLCHEIKQADFKSAASLSTPPSSVLIYLSTQDGHHHPALRKKPWWHHRIPQVAGRLARRILISSGTTRIKPSTSDSTSMARAPAPCASATPSLSLTYKSTTAPSSTPRWVGGGRGRAGRKFYRWACRW